MLYQVWLWLLFIALSSLQTGFVELTYLLTLYFCDDIFNNTNLVGSIALLKKETWRTTEELSRIFAGLSWDLHTGSKEATHSTRCALFAFERTWSSASILSQLTFWMKDFYCQLLLLRYKAKFKLDWICKGLMTWRIDRMRTWRYANVRSREKVRKNSVHWSSARRKVFALHLSSFSLFRTAELFRDVNIVVYIPKAIQKRWTLQFLSSFYYAKVSLSSILPQGIQ